MPSLRSRLLAEADSIGLSLADEVLSQVEDYINLLKKWSRAVNLTSIKGDREIFRYHFLESFYCSRFLGEKGRLADIGSGAGFPGLALKLLRPGLKIWLIEPRQKRAFFLKEVIRQLDLKDVEVVQQRLEALPQGSIQRVDYISSRAMGKFRAIARWSRQVLTAEGWILLLMSNKDVARLEAAGLRLIQKHRLPTRKEGIIALCQPER